MGNLKTTNNREWETADRDWEAQLSIQSHFATTLTLP